MQDLRSCEKQRLYPVRRSLGAVEVSPLICSLHNKAQFYVRL
jgi:hypothetical protein